MSEGPGLWSPCAIVGRKKMKEVVKSGKDISSNEEQGRRSTRATDEGVVRSEKGKVNDQYGRDVSQPA